MRYLLLSAVFLTVAIEAGILLARRRTRAHWRATLLAGACLVALTAVFDNIMISLELFSYQPELISGVRVGAAPIEDFTYPVTAVALLPALWLFLTRPGRVSLRMLARYALVVSRPVSWVNTAFPFAAAMLLTTREVDWIWAVGTLYYLIPYNLAMYGINDVFDYESDLHNPRKGGIEGALLPREFHRPLLWLIVVTNVPFLLVLLAAGGPVTWFVIAASSFAVIAYSAPGLRFKERPVLDSVTSSIHFVSPAVVGLSLAGASASAGLIVALTAFLLWGMAAHAFGAVQDIGPDREAGIGSIATVFGARRTVMIALVLWLAAGVLMLFTPWPGALAAVVALPYIVNCTPWLRVTDLTAAATNTAWRRFIWVNYFSGFIVTMILILYATLTA